MFDTKIYLFYVDDILILHGKQDKEDGSSQGYIFYLFGGPLLWKATRQATVTTSTTEAELLVLELVSQCISRTTYFRDLSIASF